MAKRFNTTTTLPQTGVTRQDFVDLAETMDPTTELVDDTTIEVVAGQLAVRLNGARLAKYTISHTALKTAATTNDIALLTLPAGGLIQNVVLKHSAAFTGGSISAYTLTVGISGDLDKYTPAVLFDVFQAPGDAVFEFATTQGIETFNASGTSIRLAAISTGADLDQSTAGSVDVWVNYGACI